MGGGLADCGEGFLEDSQTETGTPRHIHDGYVEHQVIVDGRVAIAGVWGQFFKLLFEKKNYLKKNSHYHLEKKYIIHFNY